MATDVDDRDDTDAVREPPSKVAEAIHGLECALKCLESQEVDYVQNRHSEIF